MTSELSAGRVGGAAGAGLPIVNDEGGDLFYKHREVSVTSF
jgi:hypothetical protein